MSVTSQDQYFGPFKPADYKNLVGKKISRQYKKLIFSGIKHACEMNEVILNWKKMKKIVKLFDTGGKNETKAIVTRFFLIIYDSSSCGIRP